MHDQLMHSLCIINQRQYGRVVITKTTAAEEIKSRSRPRRTSTIHNNCNIPTSSSVFVVVELAEIIFFPLVAIGLGSVFCYYRFSKVESYKEICGIQSNGDKNMWSPDPLTVKQFDCLLTAARKIDLRVIISPRWK